MVQVSLAQSASRSLTDRHRADPVKSGGVHYTPPALAQFVARQAAVASGRPQKVRVLDPACGDGALLAAMATALPGECLVELVGFDLDGVAVQQAQALVSSLPSNCSATVDKIDFIEAVLDEKEAMGSLFGKPDVLPLSGRFDLVIANPPYVRTQVLGAEKSRRLASDFGLTGRVDLYHAFAVAMTAALRPGGVLALLCSNRFLTTKTGVDLRRMLSEEYEIINIFDLGDTRTFEAAVLPAVVVGRRDSGGTRSLPMARIYEDRAGAEPARLAASVFDAISGDGEGLVGVGDVVYDVRRGLVEVTEPRDPWVPSSSSQDAWVARIDSAAVMRFGDVGQFRVGIKTTADAVFIRGNWSEADPCPESELLLPLMTHHATARWGAEDSSKQVLYPYDLASMKRSPLDLSSYPAASGYLESHRERLEGRKYVVDGGRHWWEIWVPQRPAAWARPKIVCPDISEEPRFCYDTTGAVVNGDCYWVTVEDEALAMLMLAVANSRLGVDYYDAVCGNKLYAGRRRFITQYVERFPLPDRGQAVVGLIVDAVRELVGGVDDDRRKELEVTIDSLVCKSFGVEESVW